jgi:hypothetical protein
MIVPYFGHIKTIVPYVVAILFAGWLAWWTAYNPLPDGYQNEFLHVGNTFDLYEALVRLDWWHVRWYAYTSYWPWGFYAVPLVVLLPFGKSISALVLSNLLYLSVLMWSMLRLSKVYKSPMALYLLLLTPATFGSMTRFEPNFANIAMTALGVLCLLESKQFSNRKWSMAWGVVFGSALMLDRLTVLFFLGPASIVVLSQTEWKQSSSRRNVFLSFVLFLLCTVAYYREFFIRHSAELLSQAPVGEIDSAGELLTTSNPIPSLYYLLSLLDSQAGWGIGLLMVFALGSALYKRHQKEDWVLLAAVVPGVLFFTLVAKKQVYYTFPMLVPLALLAGRFRTSGMVALSCGMLLWLQQGVGVFSAETHLQPEIPKRYVEPSYVLARPPTEQSYSVESIFDKMNDDPQEVIVFSEDQPWYEGFLVLQLRQELNGHVRGITADPIGVWEFSDVSEYLIWVRPTTVEASFPQAGSITAELISDHYQIEDLPAVSQKIEGLEGEFEHIVDWTSEEDSIISLYKRSSNTQ